MTASIQRDRFGPDWPIGFIAVITPGTPVGFMSVVDPNAYNAPGTPTSTLSNEYTVAAYEIVVQAVKPGVSHGMQLNTGNVYILRQGVSPGVGNRDDTGSMIAFLAPGLTLFLTAAALNMNVLSPYRYYVDADNAGDGALITLTIQ